MSRFPAPAYPSLEDMPPDSRLRQLYPEDVFPGGAYATLPHGRVRYWLIGPEDGIKVVLIHGLTIPAITWKEIAPVLARNGSRVLVYDLYGKGYSQAPKVTYDPVLFTTQLALLMQYVGWEKAEIVGFSMGGGVAAAFAASLPHLVREKLVFISAAGLLEVPSKRQGHPNPILGMAEIRQLQAELLPGYQDAITSIIQSGPIRGLASAYEAVGRSGFKVLIVHGTEDPVVDYSSATAIKEKVPQAQVFTVQNAAHGLLVVSPHHDKVSSALVDFLSG